MTMQTMQTTTTTATKLPRTRKRSQTWLSSEFEQKQNTPTTTATPASMTTTTKQTTTTNTTKDTCQAHSNAQANSNTFKQHIWRQRLQRQRQLSKHSTALKQYIQTISNTCKKTRTMTTTPTPMTTAPKQTTTITTATPTTPTTTKTTNCQPHSNTFKQQVQINSSKQMGGAAPSAPACSTAAIFGILLKPLKNKNNCDVNTHKVPQPNP